MSKISTTGKRYLKKDRWHDDNGPIPDEPLEWHPPMTDEEVTIAALSDPDCPPADPSRPSKARRISLARFLRQMLGMSLEGFAAAYDIPVATLRAWKRHEAEPTPVELAYLRAIERAPDAVQMPEPV
jgi:putative transcriptional regulator